MMFSSDFFFRYYNVTIKVPSNMSLRWASHGVLNRIFIRCSSSFSTIFALATGHHVRSGVAIVRVSGTSSTDSLLTLTKEKDLTKFKPNRIYLKNLYNHQTNDLIDQCMVIWFKGMVEIKMDQQNSCLILFSGPKSFTGEDVVE